MWNVTRYLTFGNGTYLALDGSNQTYIQPFLQMPQTHGYVSALDFWSWIFIAAVAVVVTVVLLHKRP